MIDKKLLKQIEFLEKEAAKFGETFEPKYMLNHPFGAIMQSPSRPHNRTVSRMGVRG